VTVDFKNEPFYAVLVLSGSVGSQGKELKFCKFFVEYTFLFQLEKNVYK